jgi:hypothetical protein
MIEKNHDRLPAICNTWELTFVLCSPPPEEDDNIMGGADLAAQFFRVLSGHGISLRKDKLATEEDNENDKEEEIERRQSLL